MRHRCTRIIRKALRMVRPQFRLDFHHGIHGVRHWSRVWFHGRHLAAELDLDPALLAWFAFLHDSQRRHDGRDAQHGLRAADFAFGLRRLGVIDELDRLAFEQLCEAMRLHSDGRTTGDIAILACWDADRLDLARAGCIPDPLRLCTPPARNRDWIREASRLAIGRPRRAGAFGR